MLVLIPVFNMLSILYRGNKEFMREILTIVGITDILDYCHLRQVACAALLYTLSLSGFNGLKSLKHLKLR